MYHCRHLHLRNTLRSLVGTPNELRCTRRAVTPRRCMSHSYEEYKESYLHPQDPLPSFLPTSDGQRPVVQERRKALANQRNNQDISKEPLIDFAALGIRKSVRVALQEAFPSIRAPTACQATFIPAILSRKDVILKDWTGTGKSFGIILALLSKERATRPRLSFKERNALAKRPITSIIVVPHRDLAYQLMHWIRLLCPHNHQDSLDSVAQVCVRGEAVSPSQQIAKLHEQAPHILIGTPTALLDILESDRAVLQIDTLDTVVVDEADYLLPVPAPGEGKKKHWSWKAHPPPTLRLLNELFKDRSKINRQESSKPWRWPLQAVFMSATLRHHIRRFLFSETTWMDRYSEVVKVDFRQEGPKIGEDGIKHFALVVDEKGAVRNFGFNGNEDGQELKSKPSRATSVPSNTGSVKPAILEAVAMTFALDVPKIALLVLQASTSVTDVLKELQDLGVNARGMAMNHDDRGKSEMMKSALKKFNRAPRAPPQHSGGGAEEPTLLVSTEASIRGLDLPELSHVFILGVPASELEYSHSAGRVGRFGREGKVVVFLDAESDRSTVRESRYAKAESVPPEERLGRLYAGLGIRPSRFEHIKL